jgi:hypothetical protein
MRWMIRGAVLLSLLTFVLLPSGALAASSASRQAASSGGFAQFASGSGGDIRHNHWAFIASSEPDGTVQGAAWFEQPDVPSMGIRAFTVVGHVTCLTQNGREATIGINVEAGTGTAVPFIGTGGLYLFAWDSDTPGSRDQFSNTWWTASPPSDCTIPPPPSGNPLVFGQVTVGSD